MSEANLTVADEFPYAFSVTEHTWIPLSDGIRLSVKLWKPEPKTDGETFPAILEAIPYRKDDVCLWDDSVRMEYFAGHGYLCARLDLRGSGDSEGALIDEYSPREQLDIVESIAWLALLPECSGNVGMTGISWSGFNSLQVAQHRPPALKGIITVCSTDDRYDNDVHYMGGSVLGFYQNWWGSIMHEFNLRPPDPRIVGQEWRSIQMDRMNNNPYLTSVWLAHQNRDNYWRPGSVCEDYNNVQCAVLAVGGWADGYTDAIVRLVDNCPNVTQGIIGPWGHTWPERGIPGPAIGFLQECLRFWDKWLKGIENGADEDPKMRYYLQEPCALTPDTSYRAGTWYQTQEFTNGREFETFCLGTSEQGETTLLGGADGSAAENELPSVEDATPSEKMARFINHMSPLTVGTQVDTWLPMGSPIDLPSEQTPDDEKSLCFDSEPLTSDVNVVGQPMVRLRVAANKPQAFVFVRLCDVWEDGTSHLITRGNMNLTHYESHEFPQDLEPGAFYTVDIPMKAVAQRIPVGHKIRLALSTNYWPWIWPSKEQATITIDMPMSTFSLPLFGQADTPLERPFLEPVIAQGQSCQIVKQGKPFTNRVYDEKTGMMLFERSTDDDSSQCTPSGFTFGSKKSTRYIINENDPLSACMESVRQSVFMRENWDVETSVISSMSCTSEDFVVRTDTMVKENGKTVLEEHHEESIPRCFN